MKERSKKDGKGRAKMLNVSNSSNARLVSSLAKVGVGSVGLDTNMALLPHDPLGVGFVHLWIPSAFMTEIRS